MSRTKSCDTVLIYSGGLDSTVLLYKLGKEGHNLETLSFHYGQRHSKELSSATDICNQLFIPFRIVELPAPLFHGSSQTSPWIPVPEGHYAEESMKQTIVPNRNMVMLALAGAYAQSIEATKLFYAAHAGDHAIYPDCRPEFVKAMDEAFWAASWRPTKLLAPFIHMTKAQIVELGQKLEVPFERTWSCYKGGSIHCGKCGTCVERKEAFQLAGVPDPTEYERNIHE